MLYILNTPNLVGKIGALSEAELVAAGATAVRIVPMFLGTGRHAREDLPVLVAQLRADHPATVFELMPAVGEDTRVIELLASMALEPTRLN